MVRADVPAHIEGMSDTKNRSRQPEGVPVGGQFAREAAVSTGLTLAPAPAQRRLDTFPIGEAITLTGTETGDEHFTSVTVLREGEGSAMVTTRMLLDIDAIGDAAVGYSYDSMVRHPWLMERAVPKAIRNVEASYEFIDKDGYLVIESEVETDTDLAGVYADLRKDVPDLDQIDNAGPAFQALADHVYEALADSRD